MDKYTVTIEADTEEHPFTQTHPFRPYGSGTQATITENNTLKLGGAYQIDYMSYNNNEDWKIHTTIKINTLGTSSLRIVTTEIGDGHNGGVFNIAGKWIDYNDNTSSGSTRTPITDITYGNNSILDIQITKEDSTITWKLTDENGNSQTIVLPNFSQTNLTNLAYRGSDSTTDIEVVAYSRLTKLN